MRTVRLNINGETKPVDVEIETTLLDALREGAGLTGTKKACEVGACGACTVLVDGFRVNACLTLAVMAEGRKIETIEGVARNGELHPLQQAFIEHDGFQCGYCTPGQIMSGLGYLAEKHTAATELAVIRESMSGNICRCGAHPKIIAAIAAIARSMSPEAQPK